MEWFIVFLLLGLLKGITAQKECTFTGDFKCPFANGYFAIGGENNCYNYYHCIFGSAVEKNCPSGEYFDSVVRSCISAVRIRESVLTQNASFPCNDDGFFAEDPCSNVFHVCFGCSIQCQSVSSNCLPGTLFDQTIGTCVSEELCLVPSTTGGTTDSFTSSSTSSTTPPTTVSTSESTPTTTMQNPETSPSESTPPETTNPSSITPSTSETTETIETSTSPVSTESTNESSSTGLPLTSTPSVAPTQSTTESSSMPISLSQLLLLLPLLTAFC